MTSHYSQMIASDIKASGKLKVYAPYDGQLIATVDRVDKLAIEQALTTASDLFNNRSKWLTAPERIQILSKLAELMQENYDRIV